jgi:hypothetical protein
VLAVADREFVAEVEDAYTALGIEHQDHVLLFVGTLCLLHGQAKLWRTIYQVVTDDPTPGAEEAFMERMTAGARRGEF